ncbi:hypothetical protein ACFQO4_06375 [Saliphagus sp. GCM10025334]
MTGGNEFGGFTVRQCLFLTAGRRPQRGEVSSLVGIHLVGIIIARPAPITGFLGIVPEVCRGDVLYFAMDIGQFRFADRIGMMAFLWLTLTGFMTE